MNTCGMFDFSLKDMYKPESKRLKTVFAAICNFAKFREDTMPLYSDLVAESVPILPSLPSLELEPLLRSCG